MRGGEEELQGAKAPCSKVLQHEAAQQEAEADSQNHTQSTWDEERMVKDEFTDASCTGVIHLDRRNQSWVGWQNEQTGNRGERCNSRQWGNVQSQSHRHQCFSGCSLRVQPR